MKPEDARKKIVRAAGEVFADKGYRGATVREICRKADVGVGAINYHFGDKEHLFAAVFEDVFSKAFEKFPADWQLAEGASPEEQLHAFVRSLLYRMYRGVDHGSIFFREMIEPIPAVRKMHVELTQPVLDGLLGIVARIAGEAADQDLVRSCVFSIMGQCFFYSPLHLRHMKSDPDFDFSDRQLDEIAAVVTRFSLGGIREIMAVQKKEVFL